MDFLIISLSIVNFKVWAAFDYRSLSFMCILKLGIWQYKDQYGWNELLMTRTITPSCRAALYYTPKQYFDYNILAVAKFSRKELLNWKKRFLVFEVRWMISFISSFISLPIHCSFSIVKIIFCSKDWSFFIVVIIFCWLSLLKSSWEQHPPLCCCFFSPWNIGLSSLLNFCKTCMRPEQLWSYDIPSYDKNTSLVALWLMMTT